MWFREIRIGLRSIIAFSTLGLLLVALGVIALYQMKQMDVRSDEVRALAHRTQQSTQEIE